MVRYTRLGILILVLCLVPISYLLYTNLQKNVKESDLVSSKFNKTVSIESQGEEDTYYVLERDGYIELEVEGPKVVKILTRSHFIAFSNQKLNYAILRKEDTELKVYKFVSRMSTSSYYTSKEMTGIPGMAKVISIDVPNGKHVYKFYLSKSEVPMVNMRFIHDTDFEMSLSFLKEIQPDNYYSEEDLKILGNKRRYYQANKQVPIYFSAKGPAKIKISSRLILDKDIDPKEKTLYKVSIFKEDVLEGIFSFEPVKSAVTSFFSSKELQEKFSISTRDDFIIRVPEGTHRYSLIPEETRSALFRIKQR
jgi:hypothetical protein